MRKIASNDAIIDRMLSGDNEIIFNLVSLIRSDENALTVRRKMKLPIFFCRQ